MNATYILQWNSPNSIQWGGINMCWTDGWTVDCWYWPSRRLNHNHVCCNVIQSRVKCGEIVLHLSRSYSWEVSKLYPTNMLFTTEMIESIFAHLVAEYTIETLCHKCVEIAFTPNNCEHQKFKHEYVLGTLNWTKRYDKTISTLNFTNISIVLPEWPQHRNSCSTTIKVQNWACIHNMLGSQCPYPWFLPQLSSCHRRCSPPS